MPTFVYMTRCDGCGHCVDICPSDIMHIDKVTRRAYNIEPNMCWECYSCVKACPHQAIDVRGYADFAPLGHSVRVKRDEEKGVIYFTALENAAQWGYLIGRLAIYYATDEPGYNALVFEPAAAPPADAAKGFNPGRIRPRRPNRS